MLTQSEASHQFRGCISRGLPATSTEARNDCMRKDDDKHRPFPEPAYLLLQGYPLTTLAILVKLGLGDGLDNISLFSSLIEKHLPQLF